MATEVFERIADATRTYRLPGWVKVVNCQYKGCHVLLLGESMREWRERMAAFPYGDSLPPVVAGVRDGRPICKRCLDLLRSTEDTADLLDALGGGPS